MEIYLQIFQIECPCRAYYVLAGIILQYGRGGVEFV